ADIMFAAAAAVDLDIEKFKRPALGIEPNKLAVAMAVGRELFAIRRMHAQQRTALPVKSEIAIAAAGRELDRHGLTRRVERPQRRILRAGDKQLPARGNGEADQKPQIVGAQRSLDLEIAVAMQDAAVPAQARAHIGGLDGIVANDENIPGGHGGRTIRLKLYFIPAA